MSLAPAETLTRDVWDGSRRSLPLPGSGETAERFEGLAALGARDLCLAKLLEPHHDATAILAELGASPPNPNSLWAVWAAEPPHAIVRATHAGSEWRLSGRKAFCSGASLVTHALITAVADDGPRLFAVDVGHGRVAGTVTLVEADWVGSGMRRAGTRSLVVTDLPALEVGDPGSYVNRPGFWHGSIGVAACWLGGARAIGRVLARSAGTRELDAHAAAHLGAVTAVLDAATAQLHAAAADIDQDPSDVQSRARRCALSLRATVAAAADQVIGRTARALGPAPLAFDRTHAEQVADLHVFIRQHHAERDLAELGRLVDGQERPQP